ncbi:triose-phosphate isomerase [Candidatus Woesearchaeota archaeon CG10_big_fil_rev_8_21_14_0_10_45_16]|nr:MAG: triose-phosphate isomerase [Candidatus Woesearchaeota archaeon CG10_big_fil_rev_8_21_14_0_10_45_16]
MRPLILINFKNYPETMGAKALTVARNLAKVRKNKYQIAIAPSLLMTKEVVKGIRLPVFAQHTDPVVQGAYTGHVSIQELKEIGVKGVILNHSEYRLPFSVLKETVALCKKKKMITIVCASTILKVRKIAKLQPDYIAYEPKKLIGGNVSVTSAKPSIIVRAVENVKRISPKTRVLCGAGVHSKADVGQALLLGTEGVLIGHAVPKAKEPKRFLEKMLL